MEVVTKGRKEDLRVLQNKARHAQPGPNLDLLLLPFVSLGLITRLRRVQNERLINF